VEAKEKADMGRGGGGCGVHDVGYIQRCRRAWPFCNLQGGSHGGQPRLTYGVQAVPMRDNVEEALAEADASVGSNVLPDSNAGKVGIGVIGADRQRTSNGGMAWNGRGRWEGR
jgi:hypothetical protein